VNSLYGWLSAVNSLYGWLSAVNSLYGWLSAVNREHRDIYRVSEELIPLHITRKAVNGFWKAISFQAGDKKVFSCQDCGDKPNTLVIDGVCIGIRLEHLEGEDIFTP
jgi:hypothetical protein